MNQLICIKHPDYKGSENPNITCKTCCKIFIAAIKKYQMQKLDEHTYVSADIGIPRTQAGGESGK